VGSAGGVDWRRADVRDPGLPAALEGVDAVVHLAMSTSPDADPMARQDLNVRGTQTVLSAAAESGAGRVVLVTSAMVHGASPENPAVLDEDAPLREEAEGLVADLLGIERLAQRSREVWPAMRVCVLRPATLVGAGADSIVTRHFAAPRLLSVREAQMRWQFVHADDVAAAIELVLTGGLPHDEATVGCDGWLSRQDVEAATGLRSLEIPASVAFATAERLHRARLTPAPASELAYVVYPWVVSSRRLREAGWAPAYDNVTALGALMADASGPAVAGRRIGRQEATLAGAGAAGVTVSAVLGAAAFVRRARRTRGL